MAEVPQSLQERKAARSGLLQEYKAALLAGAVCGACRPRRADGGGRHPLLLSTPPPTPPFAARPAALLQVT